MISNLFSSGNCGTRVTKTARIGIKKLMVLSLIIKRGQKVTKIAKIGLEVWKN